MNAIHLSVIIVLFGYLSMELATANSLPTGFLWYNDKHGHELNKSASNSELILPVHDLRVTKLFCGINICYFYRLNYNFIAK
ncbi:hypothetical protein [Orientia tsutsugamushi]